MPVSSSIGSFVFVRLFRRWAAAREHGENPLPHMYEALPMLTANPELAAASASLFELVEAHLGRRLVPECSCSSALSRDERALLGVLRHAPVAGHPFGSAEIPHGLPGAICWAAFAIRRSLGARIEPWAAEDVSPAGCPFAPVSQPAEPVHIRVAC